MNIQPPPWLSDYSRVSEILHTHYKGWAFDLRGSDGDIYVWVHHPNNVHHIRALLQHIPGVKVSLFR